MLNCIQAINWNSNRSLSENLFLQSQIPEQNQSPWDLNSIMKFWCSYAAIQKYLRKSNGGVETMTRVC